MAPEFLGHPGVRIGILTKREFLSATKETGAARDRKRIHHSIADLQIFDARPHLDNFPHELVAENVALHHGGDVPVIDMQVRAADGGGRNLDNGVPRIEDFRVGDILNAQTRYAVPAIRFHVATPSRDRRPSRVNLPNSLPPRLAGPVVVGNSPVSMSCLKRRRSSRISKPGSWPSIRATPKPK